MKKKNNKGFTLVELLAVIAVLGIITAIAIPTISSSIARKKESQLKSKTDLVLASAETYISDYRSELNIKSCYIGVQSLIKEDYISKSDIADFNDLYIVYTKGAPDNFEIKDSSFTTTIESESIPVCTDAVEPYTVTLDSQKGEGGTESITVKYGDKMPTIKVPTRNQYTFKGYYTGIGGTGIQYYDETGSSSKTWNSTDTTLYAYWEGHKYTVFLDNMGATESGTKSVEAMYELDMPSITIPSKLGYKFNGYYTEKEGQGTKYYTSTGTSATNWNIDSEKTLYAYWVISTYTVKLDNQDDKEENINITVTYNKEMPSITIPSRVGYDFSGYYSKENGKGTKYYNADGSSATNWNIDSDTTLYAYWVASNYIITLDNQFATKEGTTSVSLMYNESLTNIEVPTKKGYTFSGYYSKSDGKGTKYYESDGTSDKKYDLTTNITLYAYWIPNTYEVILDLQGATGENINITVIYDKEMPSIILPTKEGYIFNGYYSNEYGKGTKYYDELGNSAKNWNIASNTKLYAYWVAKEYTITLDNQGATEEGTTNITTTYNSQMPQIILPSRKGYTFKGYYTSVSGSGIQYYNSLGESLRTWTTDSNTTLYAYWLPKTYTITLDKQNGTGGTENIVVTYDNNPENVTVPTKEGYTFNGYYSEKEGQGTKYYDESGTGIKTWDIDSNTTLYAYWVSNKYTITFDKKGGIEGDDNIKASYNTDMPTINIPTRTGFTFKGYYTKENGSGTKYYNEDGTSAKKWDLTSDATLYAYWVANTYTVTLDNQNATETGTTSIEVTFNSEMPSITLPSRIGYTFKGYYEKKEGQGTKYYDELGKSSSTWDQTTSTTLYAYWIANSYEITLDNGEVTTEGTTNITISYDAEMPQIILPTKTGYTFNGYYTKEDGKGTKYYDELGKSSSTWNIASNTTLYAYWISNNYEVTLDLQGGDTGSNKITVTYDKEMPKIIIPTRTGYIFKGFYSGTLGSGTEYYSEEGNSVTNWNIASNTTLYAYWVANTYTITLDNKDATTEGTKKITATYGEEMPSITLPSRIGYTFKGYFTEEEGQGTQYYTSTGDSTTNWNSTIITTLYAYWVANTYTITLDNKDATTEG